MNAIPLQAKAGERQRIVLTVGLPGSGKSTWLAQNGVYAISTDEIRALLSDDPTNQNIHDRVFATARYLLRQRLAIKRPVTYLDATHLTRVERSPYIQIGDWYGCDVEALVFDVAVDECLRRNEQRTRMVPESAIRQMVARFQYPELCEGLSRVSRAESSRPTPRN